MTQSVPTREERRSDFVQRYLAQAPKLILAMRGRMSAGADDAIDVIQEVLVDLLEQMESGETPLLVEGLSDSELSRYLVRAVRNRWIDQKRRDEIKRRSYSELLHAVEAPPRRKKCCWAASVWFVFVKASPHSDRHIASFWKHS